jgi:hypothetical protein
MGSKHSRTVMVRLSSLLVVASLLVLPATQIRAQQSSDQFEQVGDPVMSAQALISDELQAGTIDFETSLVYRAYALFDDPRLPPELAGTGSLSEDPGYFGLVQSNWSQLSSETKDLLTPFVVRPTDSRSIYFKSLADGPRTLPDVSAPAKFADGTCADNWVSRDSDEVPFKVWTHCTGDYEADLAEAIRITNDFWEREVAFMGPPILDTGSIEQGGDERIDIYFVDDEADRVPRHGGDYIEEAALAHAAPDAPFDGSKSSGYIVARRPNIGTDSLVLTMAHEFFHVLQNAHNWQIAFGFKSTPYNQDFDTLQFSEFWFVEATATWVMAYLYRDTIDPGTLTLSVYARFMMTFQGYDVPVYYSPPQWSARFTHMYGAFIYFMFMEQEIGPEGIAEFWDRLEGVQADDFDTTLEILDDLLPFDENFREFTVRNLNLNLQPGDPISPNYNDLDPDFPIGFAPPFEVGSSSTSRIELGPTSPEPFVFESPIPSLSAHYVNFVVLSRATRVRFDFTALDPKDALDIDLIVKRIGQGWTRESIDASRPIEFCRANPAEAIQFGYLVLTNHAMDETIQIRNAFTISADEEPCEASGTPAP